MVVVPSTIQLADSTEIKQEEDIKQETAPVGELVDIPASQYRNASQSVELNDRDAEYDFNNLSMDETKAEMKKECDKKKEEKQKKKTNSREDMTDCQPDRQLRQQVGDDLQRQKVMILRRMHKTLLANVLEIR